MPIPPEFPTSLSLTQMLPDCDGPACYRELEVPLHGAKDDHPESDIFQAQAIAFVWTPAVFALDFHAASRRRIIVVLDGQMEIEDGRGDCRLFARGDAIDIWDTTGQGHKTRVTGGGEMHTALIEIGEQLRPDWPLIDTPRPQTGADDGSYFVDQALIYDRQAPLGVSTAPMPASGYQFVCSAASQNQKASQSQIILPLNSVDDSTSRISLIIHLD